MDDSRQGGTADREIPRSNRSDSFIDIFSYFARGAGYWLVTVISIATGEYYASGKFDWVNQVSLILLSVTLFPCYVIYATVYDLAPDSRVEQSSANASFLRRYFRGSGNQAWVSAAILAWLLFPVLAAVLLALLAPVYPNVQEAWSLLSGQRILYCALLLLSHCYYAFWILSRRNDPTLMRVRYETLLPVMIVAFSFFSAATTFHTDFQLALCVLPLLIFSFFAYLRKVEQRRMRATGRDLTPTLYARVVTLFVIAVPPTTFGLGRLASGEVLIGVAWASAVTVAVAVGLYLSLFELWRLTGKLNERVDMGVTAAKSLENYYAAIIVAHAVAIAALPLVFLFGNFGWYFMVAALIHATTAFFFWYRFGTPGVIYDSWWRKSRILFVLVFFGVVALGVLQRPKVGDVLPNLYPRHVSGISASLLVAIVVALLASPFVQYFTEEDGRSGRPRAFGEVFRSFFYLKQKTQVFRLAAVLCGSLFIAMNFLYEVARFLHWPIKLKTAVAFWIYAAATVCFSSAAFFVSSHRPDEPGPNPPSGGAAVVLAAIIGGLQTLRVTTGVIMFLGVAVVGFASGAPLISAVFMGAAIALVGMASFALNDYYDWRKDVVNAPHRAVPSGRLSPRGVLSIGLCALVAGVFIGLRAVEGASLGIFLVGALGGALYNEFVRRLPHLKGVMTAALCSLVAFFDIVTFDLSSTYAWIGCACFVFVLGRELLMDVRDHLGDARVGMATAAVRWGDSASSLLGFALLVASLLPLTLFVMNGTVTLARCAILAVYGTSIGAACLVWFKAPSTRRRWLAIELLRVPLVAGIAAMVLA